MGHPFAEEKDLLSIIPEEIQLQIPSSANFLGSWDEAKPGDSTKGEQAGLVRKLFLYNTFFKSGLKPEVKTHESMTCQIYPGVRSNIQTDNGCRQYIKPSIEFQWNWNQIWLWIKIRTTKKCKQKEENVCESEGFKCRSLCKCSKSCLWQGTSPARNIKNLKRTLKWWWKSGAATCRNIGM